MPPLQYRQSCIWIGRSQGSIRWLPQPIRVIHLVYRDSWNLMLLLRLKGSCLSTSFSFLRSGHLFSYPILFSGNSRSRFRGLGCETPPPARFSVKIPQPCEDDFCRNRLRHDLAGWNKGGSLSLPTNRDDWHHLSYLSSCREMPALHWTHRQRLRQHRKSCLSFPWIP